MSTTKVSTVNMFKSMQNLSFFSWPFKLSIRIQNRSVNGIITRSSAVLKSPTTGLETPSIPPTQFFDERLSQALIKLSALSFH
jgi:hypothetical protein